MQTKFFKTFIVIGFIFIANNCNAQTSLKDYIDAVTNMPKLFKSLIDGADQLGTTVDKINYSNFSTEMEFAIVELRGDKELLLTMVKSNSPFNKSKLNIGIIVFQKKVSNLQAVLKKHEGLIKGLAKDGFSDASKFSHQLNVDFSAKQQLLSDIINASAAQKLVIANKLQASIDSLNSSIAALHTFNKALEKK